MKTKKFCFVVAFVLLFSPLSWSQVESSEDSGDTYTDLSRGDEEIQNYDAIVKDLSRAPVQAKSRAKAKIISSGDSGSFENTTIHAGVAYANMLETLDLPTGKIYLGQPGVQVSLGIDLFSTHISSEGTLLTFGDQNYAGTSVSVKEFDLMFYGKGSIATNMKAKVGGGIAGRYLTVNRGGVPVQYSTPSSVLSLGADYYFADAVSLGGEIAMRNAMTGETVDERSYTMLIRLDTHF